MKRTFRDLFCGARMFDGDPYEQLQPPDPDRSDFIPGAEVAS